MPAQENDTIRLYFLNGPKLNIECKPNNIPWPPPEVIDLMGFLFRRTSMSNLTDEQAAEMRLIGRGAEYMQIDPNSLGTMGGPEEDRVSIFH